MVGMADQTAFTKGHGTENDFVLVPDLEGVLELTAEQAARLADRRAGIGGDGVIRVVPTAAAHEPDAFVFRSPVLHVLGNVAARVFRHGVRRPSDRH